MLYCMIVVYWFDALNSITGIVFCVCARLPEVLVDELDEDHGADEEEAVEQHDDPDDGLDGPRWGLGFGVWGEQDDGPDDSLDGPRRLPVGASFIPGFPMSGLGPQTNIRSNNIWLTLLFVLGKTPQDETPPWGDPDLGRP